jgi:hypothetical protein
MVGKIQDAGNVDGFGREPDGLERFDSCGVDRNERFNRLSLKAHCTEDIESMGSYLADSVCV